MYLFHNRLGMKGSSKKCKATHWKRWSTQQENVNLKNELLYLTTFAAFEPFCQSLQQLADQNNMDVDGNL